MSNDWPYVEMRKKKKIKKNKNGSELSGKLQLDAPTSDVAIAANKLGWAKGDV